MKKTYQLHFEGMVECEFEDTDGCDFVISQILNGLEIADISSYELRESDPNSVSSYTVVEQYP